MTPIKYATANDVFASLFNGGSISVEEFPGGDIAQAALIAERAYNNPANDGTFTAPLVISLTTDRVDDSPADYVWFHPDQTDRLAVLDRARAAIDAAEAALKAVGYVDDALIAEQTGAQA